ncbi:hypothetical protein CQE07_15210 [Salmonella enterica subsp. enterica serovar Typhimurium]|nr:hypothetical protein [Salmonella enterica subsp. enterica serovar Typhimurium]
MSIKNDGHYFCRAGGNRPDGLNEPVTYNCLCPAGRSRVRHLSYLRMPKSLMYRFIQYPAQSSKFQERQINVPS